MTLDVLLVSAASVVIFVQDAVLWGIFGFLLAMTMGVARGHFVLSFLIVLGLHILIDGFMTSELMNILQVEIGNRALANFMGVGSLSEFLAVDLWFVVSGICQTAVGFWTAKKMARPLIRENA